MKKQDLKKLGELLARLLRKQQSGQYGSNDAALKNDLEAVYSAYLIALGSNPNATNINKQINQDTAQVDLIDLI